MIAEVYTFEDEDGHEFGCFHTTDYEHAKQYGQQFKLRVIAHKVELRDSELVADFTERRKNKK